MPDGLALTIAQLSGQAPPARPGGIHAAGRRAAADRLRRAATALRNTRDADCVAVAQAIEHYLAGRGRLDKLLGIAGRRGGAHDDPRRRDAEEAKRRAVRALAELSPGATNPAKEVARLLQANAASARKVLVLHGVQPEEMPHSVPQLRRILREP